MAVANNTDSAVVSVPVTSGRPQVRAMRASMLRSMIWFTAAADAACRAMPSVPQNRADSGGSPGTARNMPTIAVNTISMTTRGLHSS
jgi:hypothetical protein